MAKLEVKEQLKSLLRELFQLDNTDLDFGIYRILNLKSKEVEEFISIHLDAKVEEVKNKILQRQSTDIKAELEAAKKDLTDKFQIDFNVDGDIDAKSKQYGQLPLFQEPFNRMKDARERLNALKVSEDTEKSIYNELYRFFDRYYEGGDFISKPRAGKNNYLIPYEGEEVKMYWANHDQYYIKTGDNFKNYVFNNQSADPVTLIYVEFKIIDAEVAINNNKEEKGRLFVPAENPVEWIDKEKKLLVKFYYKVPTPEEKKLYGDKQSVKTENKGINQRLFAIINSKIKEINNKELLLLHAKTRTNSKGDAIPIIQYHLERYTTVNKFNYFIHKNLKEFLSRELDFFLKNEVLSIQFLNQDWNEQEVQDAIKNNLLKASCIRELSLTIIDFIGELEDFQKRLFEKKKIVVQSDYCLTIDLIPSNIYDEIINYILSDENKKQINEWLTLNFISKTDLIPDKEIKNQKKKENGFASAKSFLKTHDKLVVDTQYLPANIKWKLLSSIENLEDKINGLLINSENLQALNLLQKKYNQKVKVVYIDPPYNTELDRQQGKFVYKDSFEHSTWLAMMKDRITFSSSLLEKNGVHFQSIGDDELQRSLMLYENTGYRVLGNFTWKRTRTGGHLSNTVNKLSEYVIIADKGFSGQMLYGGKADPEESQPMNKEGNSMKCLVFKPNEITFINETDDEFIIEIGEYGTNASKVKVLEPIMVRNKQNVNEAKLEGNFTWTQDFLLSELKRGARIIIKEKRRMLPRFFRESEFTKPFPSMPNEDIQVGTNEDGSALLYSQFNDDLFDYPKPLSLIEILIESKTYYSNDGYILDYFAGSGTTGNAVISLNRKTDGNRKYILVEMGNYFYSVTKPRIKKIIFSDTWEEGKPVQNGTGISQIFQYIKLEQYEDALNNIVFNSITPQLSFIDNIRYQLNTGTKGSDSLINLDKFTRPFDYSMKILKQNEPITDTPIDLVTTFNFLLGIDIISYKLLCHDNLEYRIVIGKKGKQQYIIIWRNFGEDTNNLTSERDWIIQLDWYDKNAIVFCNGDNAFSANPIEPEFFRLMTEPVN